MNHMPNQSPAAMQSNKHVNGIEQPFEVHLGNNSAATMEVRFNGQSMCININICLNKASSSAAVSTQAHLFDFFCTILTHCMTISHNYAR